MRKKEEFPSEREIKTHRGGGGGGGGDTLS